MKQSQQQLDEIDKLLSINTITKEIEEQNKQLRAAKEESYASSLELLEEVHLYLAKCSKYYTDILFNELNDAREELDKYNHEKVILTLQNKEIEFNLNYIQNRNILVEIFDIVIKPNIQSIGGYGLAYSLEKIDEFNQAMGKLSLVIYLLGKVFVSTEKIVLRPFGNQSKITDQRTGTKVEYNLFASVKAYYYEIDEKFQKGFELLVIYFNSIYNVCTNTWPDLKENENFWFVVMSFVFFINTVSIDITHMTISDPTDKKIYNLRFNPSGNESFNFALRTLLKMIQYIFSNYPTLLQWLYRSQK